MSERASASVKARSLEEKPYGVFEEMARLARASVAKEFSSDHARQVFVTNSD